jgi:secreted trypsin-like serine protease
MHIKTHAHLSRYRCTQFSLYCCKILCALLGFLSVACDESPSETTTSSLKQSDGEAKKISQRIVGGQLENAYPAVGAIVSASGTLCTATLIANDWILTAAHCIESDALVFVLGLKIDHPKAEVPIDQVVIHPNYSASPIENDLALAHLSMPILDVQPMGILTDIHKAKSTNFTFVGYGLTGGFVDDSGVKRSVQIPMNQLFDNKFSYQKLNRNTCSGDSGGPALAYYEAKQYIVGTTSYGDSDCKLFGVDMRTDVYLPFFESVIGKVSTELALVPVSSENMTGTTAGTTAGTTSGTTSNTTSGTTSNTTTEDPRESPCGSIDFIGVCLGNAVYWCEDEKLLFKSCEQTQCGWIDDQIGYDCQNPVDGEMSENSDASGGSDEDLTSSEGENEATACDPYLTYQGTCDGDLLVWCEAGIVQAQDCHDFGLKCIWVDEYIGNDCL